jgi:predicted Zn-dependent peptidase
MRFFRLSRAVIFLVWSLGCLLQAQGLLPEVQEQKLKNGFRVLLVERPGTGAIHARLFLQGGSASTGALPAVASELLARCLFQAPLEGEAKSGKDLEASLQQEEGAFESLRLARIRLARRSVGVDSEEIQGLEMLHRLAFLRVQELAEKSLVPGPLKNRGAARQDLRVEADQVSLGLDLPREGFLAYCRALAERLKTPLLARFPQEREALLRELNDDSGRDRRALDVLLSSSLSGHPYAQVCDIQRASVEALTWSDLRAYARWACAPERLVLVLVGDLKMPEVRGAVEPSFGGLSPATAGWGHRDDLPVEIPEGSGARRIQASIPGEKRLFLGWRVPPLTHPDHPALQVLVQMLGGGTTSRLPRRLSGDSMQAESLSVRLDLPGGRDANLLVIEAKPAERHGLPELEQAIQGELIRLQRGGFQEGEIRRAQRQVEVDQLMVQEDAAQLAQVMGTAICQGGDWQLAFRALQFKQDFTQQEIQGIAQKYLISSRSTTVLLEPDPILMPQDRLEGQMAEILTRILSAKLDDPGRVESVVREALRQLRMLPLKEREQTLKLLEAQVKP